MTIVTAVPRRLVTTGLVAIIATVMAVAAIGCGPVQSTSGISQAEAAVERARVHDADEYSPYEYRRAELYLYKAKHQWGYSNFEAARDYSRQARRAASAAIDNTHEAPWQGHPVYGLDGRPDEIEELEQRFEQADDIDDVQQIDDTTDL